MDVEFDAFARDYDAQIERGLALAGETKEYFAERRAAWLANLLNQHDVAPRVILDYGCGTGTVLGCLLQSLGPERLIGVDVSTQSLKVARQTVAGGDSRVQLGTLTDVPADVTCDVAYTSGVFHHIARAERAAALEDLRRRIRPGGLLAFWEHNRRHPGTQAVVWRIALDRNAVLISAPSARRMLRNAGFEPLRTDYLFVFPRALASLRGLEPALAQWPFGAQYLVLARRS